jgi:hypothetical protein
MDLIKLFIWIMRGCPLYLGAITAAAVGAGVAAAGSIAGAAISSSGAKGASKTAGAATEKANLQQLTLAQQAYVKQVQAQQQADQIINEAYAKVNPQIGQAYDQSNSIIGQTYGSPGQAARGTDPAQAQQINQQFQQIQGQSAQAQQQVDAIKQQLDGMQYSAQTAPMIQQLQQQYVQAQQQVEALAPQLQQAQQAVNNIQPYQAAQDAQVGRAPQALMTGTDQANQAIAEGGLMAKGFLDSGYNAARSNITNANWESNKAINSGYDTAGNQLKTGYDQAIATQQPFLKAGTVGLNNMTSMVTPGNKYLPTDPGYQFRLDQGNKGINNSAAASGGLLSGATLKAIADYNSGAASQEFAASYGRNQSLAGIGQQAGNNISNYQADKGTGLAGLSTDKAQQLSQIAQSMGLDLANLNSDQVTKLSALAETWGINKAQNENSLGTGLSNLETQGGNALNSNVMGRNEALTGNTLNQANYLATNQLNNATSYADTIGSTGKDIAARTTDNGIFGASAQMAGSGAWATSANQLANIFGQTAYNYANPKNQTSPYLSSGGGNKLKQTGNQ